MKSWSISVQSTVGNPFTSRVYFFAPSIPFLLLPIMVSCTRYVYADVDFGLIHYNRLHLVMFPTVHLRPRNAHDSLLFYNSRSTSFF